MKRSPIPPAAWRAAAVFSEVARMIRAGEYNPADDMADAQFRVDYRFGYAPRGDWKRVNDYERRMWRMRNGQDARAVENFARWTKRRAADKEWKVTA